jgi:hypothetical protein
LEGTYAIVLNQDTSYYLHLVEGKDGAVYGELRSNSGKSGASDVMRIDSMSADSVFLQSSFGRYAMQLELFPDSLVGSAQLPGYRGKLRALKTSDRPPDYLTATKRLVPLDLPINRPAFPAFREDGRFYIVGGTNPDDLRERGLFLVEETDVGWRLDTIAYDRNRYTIAAVGLSPNEQTLVAQGVRQDTNTGTGADLFLLHLSDPTTIARVARIPEPVSTISYDIFPAFTPDGDIVYSSGVADTLAANPVKTELFLARKGEDSWKRETLSPALNTYRPDAAPFMDHRGRFLLFYRKQGKPSIPHTLFLSKKKDGQWSAAKRLASDPILPYAGAYGGRIDRSGSHLYFTSYVRGRGYLYRIPVSDTPTLKPFFE